MCMCSYLCVHTNGHVHETRGLNQVSSQSLPILFLRRGLSLDIEVTDSATLAGQWAIKIVVSPSAGIIDTATMPDFLCGWLGPHASMALWPSHLPSPRLFKFLLESLFPKH